MSDLKPCPFCGSTHVSSAALAGKLYIKCESCFARIHFPAFGLSIQNQKDRYNRRELGATKNDLKKAMGTLDELTELSQELGLYDLEGDI